MKPISNTFLYIVCNDKLFFRSFQESKKLNQHDKKYMETSVKDVPSPRPHRPFDTRLAQQLSERGVIYQAQGIRSVEDAAHIIEFWFFGALGRFIRTLSGETSRESVRTLAVRGHCKSKQNEQDKHRKKFIFHTFLK
jgi:hypothetical protein